MNFIQIIEREVGYIYSLPIDTLGKIKLWQMFFRSLTFDSQIHNLLHGSCAITKRGNAILFGDGIDCIGKTTTSLAVAAVSQKYVIDEFTIYNQATGSVYGISSMPILVRENGKEVLKLPRELGFETVTTAKLAAIVCPHPSSQTLWKEENNLLMKIKKIAICATAHRLKFYDNDLDRVNGKRMTSDIIELVDYTCGYQVPEGLTRLPYFDAWLEKPDDINILLERSGL